LELDRNAIERADFAQARRGYDPDEVAAHLAEVAAAVEQLKASGASARPGRAAAGSLAAAAADQVRTIVEAAERSAAEIESGARTEADRVTGEAKRQAEQDRSEAQSDASRTRDEAESHARQAREQAESDAAGHVAQVEAATTDMRRRADTVGTDLNALVDQLRSTIDNMLESVRSSAGSLETELGGINAGLAEVRAAQPEPVIPSEPDAEAVSVDQAEPLYADEPATAGDPETGDMAAAGGEPAVPATAYDDELSEPAGEVAAPEDHEYAEPTAEESSAAPASGRGDGGEGARLIALNMALNGTPREETSRYLEENFDLQDREGILDEVYARVGG